MEALSTGYAKSRYLMFGYFVCMCLCVICMGIVASM